MGDSEKTPLRLQFNPEARLGFYGLLGQSIPKFR